MLRKLCLLATVLAVGTASAQKKEVVELQRDIAILQDQVRALQSSVGEKLSATTVLLQQTLDAANKANTSVAVLDASIRDRLKDQEKNVVAPVAGLGAKVDQMSNDFASLRESVNDLTSRMGKLQQQMVDLGNAIKTLQSPPPPPGATGSAPVGMAAAPPVPATTLYENAMRDKNGGKLDLALAEFTDYLRYYGETDMAANAQFHIGDIAFTKGDYDSALAAFDQVLEKYPDNNKTPDALYMKGQSFVKLNRPTRGAKEFQELIKRFPRSDLAAKARTQLRNLGVAPPAAARRR